MIKKIIFLILTLLSSILMIRHRIIEITSNDWFFLDFVIDTLVYGFWLIVSIIVTIYSIKKTRKEYSLLNVLPVIIIGIGIIFIGLTEIFREKDDKSLTLLIAHYDGDLNGIRFELRENSTYKIDSYSTLGGAYYYGKYNLIGDTIFLDKKNPLGKDNDFMTDKLIIFGDTILFRLDQYGNYERGYFTMKISKNILIIDSQPSKKTTSQIKESNPVQESTNELDYIPVDTSIPKTLTTQNFNIQVKTNLHKWVNYYDKLSDDFNIDSFRNTSTTILQPYQEPLDDTLYVERFFDLYEPYLIWSQDSSMAIDLYSYSHVLEYDSEGKVYGMRDVDCQLALMDRVNQKRIIINTWGPAAEFQDAFWLNNDTIIVTGIEYEFDDTYKPYYCMIDLQTYLVRYYGQDKELGFKNNTYIDMIFEEIEFDF